MSKYKLGSLDTKGMLKFWKDFTVESKDIKSENKGQDLYRVELTNGEELLCRACFEDDCPGEYRLEVIAPEVFSYDVTKEEIKKITKYTNCKVIAISNELKNKIEEPKETYGFTDYYDDKDNDPKDDGGWYADDYGPTRY